MSLETLKGLAGLLLEGEPKGAPVRMWCAQVSLPSPTGEGVGSREKELESGALLSLPPLQSSAWHGGSQAGTRLQLQPRNPERRGWPGGGSRGYRSPPHPLPELQPNPTALAALPF